MKNILVYIEVEQGSPNKLSLETLSKASEIAKELSAKSVAVVIENINEDGVNKLKGAGADVIVKTNREEYSPEDFANIIAKVAAKNEIKTILVPGSLNGKDVAAYLSAKLDTVSITNVCDIKVQGDELTFVSPTYGGTVLTEMKLNTDTYVATVRSGSFEKREDLNGAGEVVEEEISKDDIKAIIKDVIKAAGADINLEDAPVIVTCGRGASTGKSFELVNKLAQVLDAPISGTRPVIDDGILPKTSQIGQSGKIVSPDLYIGCGVSGAVQHISGMKASKFIVAINKDEDAPIFEMADVGIVGDCEKILPLFIEEIEKIKSEN